MVTGIINQIEENTQLYQVNVKPYLKMLFNPLPEYLKVHHSDT